MRVLGSAVLVMEFFVMCFAMLIAKDHEPSTLVAGAVIAILLLLTPGLLKKRTGWILGSLLQFLIIGYAVVVPSLATTKPCSIANGPTPDSMLPQLGRVSTERWPTPTCANR